jgi:hypothetical protein
MGDESCSLMIEKMISEIPYKTVQISPRSSVGRAFAFESVDLSSNLGPGYNPAVAVKSLSVKLSYIAILQKRI